MTRVINDGDDGLDKDKWLYCHFLWDNVDNDDD